MTTYYLSVRCKPAETHPEPALYRGMVADLFVSAESEAAVEQLTFTHLKEAGWAIEEVEHAEEVSKPSTHDARFAELYRNSQIKGVASIFSPF